MPTVKFTSSTIAKLKAPTKSGRQEIIWDADLRGFGILLSGVSNSRSYIVQRKVSGTRATRRITVGPANVLDLDTARRKALDVLRTFADGKDPKREAKRTAIQNITLAQAFNKFLAERDNLSAAVRYRWPQYMQRFMGDWLDRPLAAITAEELIARRGKIMKDVAARGRARSPAFVSAPGAGMASQVLTAFKAIRAHVADDAGLGTLKLKWPRSPVNRRERLVRSEDLPGFYKAVLALGNPRDRDLILLLLYTGLRFSEAASMQWADLDFPQRVIRISAIRTKARRRLDLPMTSQVRDLLVARRAIGIEGTFVFPSVKRWAATGHANDLSHAFYEIARTSGLRLSPHDLRRTWATIAESCDIAWGAMVALLNHAAPAGVSGGYVLLSAERLREPAQRVADRIAELCGVETPDGVARLG